MNCLKTMPIFILALALVTPSLAQEASSTDVGEDGFLQPGTWWNLYFTKANDPLKRGSGTIHAVKVVEVDQQRPSWIKIRMPMAQKEHLSILDALAKASKDDGLTTAAAISQWEKSIFKWRTIWVNLNHVIYVTKVEEDRRESKAE